jgi:hypothetical protein
MRVRIVYILSFIFLLTSCGGLTDPIPTSTSDPCSKDVLETALRDFEDLKNEIDDLALEAADTPAEDLELIVRQMTALKEEIEGYEFPLCAAKTQSALYNYSLHSEQCIFYKYAQYINAVSHPEEEKEHCDRAQLFEEGYEQMLQGLKEMIAEK